MLGSMELPEAENEQIHSTSLNENKSKKWRPSTFCPWNNRKHNEQSLHFWQNSNELRIKACTAKMYFEKLPSTFKTDKDFSRILMNHRAWISGFCDKCKFPLTINRWNTLKAQRVSLLSKHTHTIQRETDIKGIPFKKTQKSTFFEGKINSNSTGGD